jgi:hypothetical protein
LLLAGCFDCATMRVASQLKSEPVELPEHVEFRRPRQLAALAGDRQVRPAIAVGAGQPDSALLSPPGDTKIGLADRTKSTQFH